MTDTTEIAALRRRSNNLRTPDQTDAFIDLLLDKLEAERQRAASSDAMLTECIDSLKAAEAEIVRLKGDQVPYGYYSAETATILEQQGHANITKTPSGNWQFPLFTRAQSIPDMVHWSADEEWSQAQCLGWNMCRDAMLFTAPQKPVALSFEQWLESKGDNPVGWVREAMKEAYDAAIEAAGGIVKVGE